jgi:hypothetical protein
MSTKTASKLALAALASASTASGAIVVFDVTDVTYDNQYSGGFVRADGINLANGTYGTGITAPYITIAMSLAYAFSGSGYGVGLAKVDGDRLQLLSGGASISSSLSFTSDYETASRYGSDLPRDTFYLGMKLTGGADTHFGWFEFTSADYAGGYTQVTFKRFAFNDVAGESILAGQTTAVPEASTLGLVGGLFGLVALAHARRRKAKQAAASEKFLALAAGEKLN